MDHNVETSFYFSSCPLFFEPKTSDEFGLRSLCFKTILQFRQRYYYYSFWGRWTGKLNVWGQFCAGPSGEPGEIKIDRTMNPKPGRTSCNDILTVGTGQLSIVFGSLRTANDASFASFFVLVMRWSLVVDHQKGDQSSQREMRRLSAVERPQASVFNEPDTFLANPESLHPCSTCAKMNSCPKHLPRFNVQDQGFFSHVILLASSWRSINWPNLGFFCCAGLPSTWDIASLFPRKRSKQERSLEGKVVFKY